MTPPRDGTCDWAHTFLGILLRDLALKSILPQAQGAEEGFSLKEGFETDLTCTPTANKRQEQEMQGQ